MEPCLTVHGNWCPAKLHMYKAIEIQASSRKMQFIFYFSVPIYSTLDSLVIGCPVRDAFHETHT